jgi:hypothetical protein
MQETVKKGTNGADSSGTGEAVKIYGNKMAASPRSPFREEQLQKPRRLVIRKLKLVFCYESISILM